jgi:hypothetical protein
MKKIFIAIVIALPIMAFATGAAFARTPSAKNEERLDAVDAYMLTVTETEPTVVVVEPEQPTRTYFDIPLSYDVQDHIFAECETHNIDPAIIVAMIYRESKFDTYALGDDGRSAGLMQIQAKWHLQRMIKLGCTDLFDQYQNITVGVDILAELLDRYGGDMAKALTAYNRGAYQGTVTSYAKEILNNAEKH